MAERGAWRGNNSKQGVFSNRGFVRCYCLEPANVYCSVAKHLQVNAGLRVLIVKCAFKTAQDSETPRPVWQACICCKHSLVSNPLLTSLQPMPPALSQQSRDNVLSWRSLGGAGTNSV